MRLRPAALLALLALGSCVGPGAPPQEIPPPTPTPEPTPPPVMAPPPDEQLRWRGNVAVCIANAEAEDPIDQIERAAATWSDVSGLKLSIVAGCTSIPLADYIVRGELIRTPGALAATDSLGNTLGLGRAVHFRIDYDWRDPICGDRGSVGRLNCIYADALHELGHVLGFSHDHVSTSAPTCEGMRISGESTDKSMSYYDPRSIMNYCNRDRFLGILSAADICSVQVAYPIPNGRTRTAEECAALAASTDEAVPAPTATP